MSKLQELIDRLCPNGVEFEKLGQLIDIYYYCPLLRHLRG